MKSVRLLCGAGLCAALACSSPSPDGSDAGTAAPDAGHGVPAPLPFPLVRMADDGAGTSHANTFQGVVTAHGPAREDPFTDGSTPARVLEVKLTDGSAQKLFYTLPAPFAFAAFPSDPVKVTYRERAAGFGSSYGARVQTITGLLKVLVEDGAVGSAFEDGERLGFTFALDPQPLSEERVDCGRKVHYPAVVQNGAKKKRLFGGQAEGFTLDDGENVTFTLLDAWRIEDSTCADVPAFAIGYLVTPS